MKTDSEIIEWLSQTLLESDCDIRIGFRDPKKECPMDNAGQLYPYIISNIKFYNSSAIDDPFFWYGKSLREALIAFLAGRKQKISCNQ